MARILFKGEPVEVRVTHNVLSEMIRVTGTSYTAVMSLSGRDPFGWLRDILYCSLLVYNPSILGEMTKYEVGDELFQNSTEDQLVDFIKQLHEDFVKTKNGDKKAASNVGE